MVVLGPKAQTGLTCTTNLKGTIDMDSGRLSNSDGQVPFSVGYFTTLDNRDNRLPYAEVLDNFVEQTLLCESKGYSIVWSGEHHFGHEGVDIHPNPIVTGSYLAALTSKIRIGFAGLILPQWHPLRAAEDVALLDQLSGGRVECGVGRGIAVRELVNLNRDADRRNHRRNWELFRESVDIMRRAWTEDPFTYDGLFYRIPEHGVPDHTAGWYERDPRYRSESGDHVALRVVPKPLQQPHPPIWNVVDGTPGFRLAAELDIRPACWLRTTNGIVEAYGAYREEMERLHARQLRLGENCGLLRAVVVADSMDEARKIAADPVSFYFGSYVAGHRGRQLFVEPGDAVEHETTQDWFDFLRDRDHLLAGTPEDVAEQIIRLREATGVEHLMTLMTIPGVPHEDVMRSIELFGGEVLPLVSRSLQLASAGA
jgi:alkanesulfonate monooxygenase SsuD/methylene tetrahydromethanopterin reductase-like flavin-dependent oxidoreductase (luciferase family)